MRKLLCVLVVLGVTAVSVATSQAARHSTNSNQASDARKQTHAVDATMTLAIIGDPEGSYEFAARLTGKPFGTAAAIGVQHAHSTETGLITKGRPVVYAKKGTLDLKTTDVVEFQPDGSIQLNGTFKVLDGSGKYEGATGEGTFNAELPPGSTLKVGLVTTFHVEGEARY